MKYATPGSISSGTLRTEDLLDAFAFELEDLVQRNAEAWCSDDGRAQRDAYLALVAEAREMDPDDDDVEFADETSTLLEEALQDFAPPYFYFGTNEGDGSDFGFWLSQDTLDEALYEKEVLKVDDTSEVPADYSGEVLHVNDHGNMTLFSAHNGELTEIWSLV